MRQLQIFRNARSAKMSAHGTFETSTDVRYAAAFGGNADISQWLPDNRDL
jgi:hypothetical protein